jgi:integrase
MQEQARAATGRRLVPTRHPGIYKRGGRYCFRFRSPDGRVRQRSTRTLAEARTLRSALVGDVARGEYRELSRVGFADYATTWIETYTGRSSRGVRPQTLADYRRDLERHAVPYFGRMRLAEVEPRHVKAFAKALADREPRPSPATIRRTLAPLKALFATALEEGVIRHNPAAGLRLTTPDLREEDCAKALTDEELAAVIDATAPEWRILIRTLADTGLRIGEAIALRWEHVDFGRRRIMVRERRYKGTVDAPKSRYGRRDVRISAGLAQDLWRHRQVASFKNDSDPVFATKDGTPHLPENLHRRVLKPAAERAGVPWCSFHTLRHTAASRFFRAGSNAKQVQAVLGHHSPAFTLATYVHLIDDDLPDPGFLDALYAHSAPADSERCAQDSLDSRTRTGVVPFL